MKKVIRVTMTVTVDYEKRTEDLNLEEYVSGVEEDPFLFISNDNAVINVKAAWVELPEKSDFPDDDLPF